MSTANLSFAELIQRARSGCADAAAQLFAEYRSDVQRVVRLRLSKRFRGQLESDDICQSVLADFFVRLALGQYHLETPENLSALLFQIAKHKLIKRVEGLQAAKRDIRRRLPLDVADMNEPSPSKTPSSIVANAELLAEVKRRLSQEELLIAERRLAGEGWVEIAKDHGGNAHALRMRFTRALDRVADQLRW